MSTKGIPWSEAQRAKVAALRGTLRDRFLSKVEADPNSGCWLWSGAYVRSTGYGTIQHNGRTLGAHCVSYELFKGEREGLFVCHRCDVRLCVNPAHLFLGTPAENIADMNAKGRGRPVRGDAHVGAKLSSADIPGIRARIDAGETMLSIASDFGVDQCAINAIRRGRTWKSVTFHDGQGGSGANNAAPAAAA